MSEPRTKAGRTLLEALSNLAADLPLEFGDEPLERLDIEATLRIILAIEAEARSEGHKEGYLSRAQDEEFRSGGAPAPLDVDVLAKALDVLSEDGEYDLMAPEEREERFDAAERLADAYARLAEGTDR